MPEHGQKSIDSHLDPERPVGWQSRKTYALKIANGFFDRYLPSSATLEIGYKGGIYGAAPIVPRARGIDIDDPGYDGTKPPSQMTARRHLHQSLPRSEAAFI
jgi:hypothetical protein